MEVRSAASDGLPGGFSGRPTPPRPLRTLPGGEKDVEWTPDGRSVVATFLDGAVRVWDSTNGTERRSLALPARVEDALLAPEGRRLLARWSGTQDGHPETSGVALLDLGRGAVLARWPDDAWYGMVGFAPDGRTLLGFVGGEGHAREATVWDAATGAVRARFRLLSGVDKWAERAPVVRTGRLGNA